MKQRSGPPADAPDTSVVVAALSAWHPDHEAARLFLAKGPEGLAHVVTETFSVLTRIPHPRRIGSPIALAAIRRAFPRRLVSLPPTKIFPLFERLAGAGIQGGAVYDAIVAETARLSGLRLVSLDERAQSTYRAVGVDVGWLIE